MQERVWVSAEDLLMLFCVDPSTPGAADFCRLVREAALLLQFPELQSGTWAVATSVMRQRHWSPMVYWSRQKRVLKPLLEAEASTLEALGLKLGDKHTVYALAHAAASCIAARGEGDYAEALQLRAGLSVPIDG